MGLIEIRRGVQSATSMSFEQASCLSVSHRRLIPHLEFPQSPGIEGP